MRDEKDWGEFLRCVEQEEKKQTGHLDINSLDIRELGPISALTHLQRLICWNNQVRDLRPLKNLTNLQELDCCLTQVSDLSPLQDFTNLQTLECSDTQVSDLSPLKGLTHLQELNCSETLVTDLRPLKHLTNLQKLNCSETQVSDLSPLKHLPNLQTLTCHATQVSDLSPLKDLANLQSLVCSEIPCRDIPPEILSKHLGENCLPRLRAYWAETAFEAFDRAKIIILGNGQVGKTQLARYLNTQTFDPTIKTTHGIQILRPQVDVTGSEYPKDVLDASLWDFGGQDIYHGTHGLFLKSQAVFVICWSPTQEDHPTQELNGLIHQNHPVDYWLSYVRAMAGDDAPVIIVQTHCDLKSMDDDRMNRFNTTGLKWVRKIGFGAEKRKGGEALRQAIGDAAAHLKGQKDLQLGSSWVRVIKALEAAQDKGEKSMSVGDFQALCDEHEVLAEAKYVLGYCHNIGVVFYREGYFDGDIILDQQWALDAVYAVLDRGSTYQRIKAQNGRFRRDDLGGVWANYKDGEQDLFLKMMQSCGLIFALYEAEMVWSDKHKTVYIVPELLPKEREDRPELGWVEGGAILQASFGYSLLHKGVMRDIISQIGKKAGLFANYWQGGIQLHDRHTDSSAIIEESYDGQRGQIIISCQGDKSAVLLETLIALVSETNSRIGIKNTPPDLGVSLRDGFKDTSRSPLNPGQTKASEQQDAWYVSYAWGDRDGATEDERKREILVDELCAEAQRRGKLILRDKTYLRAGECFERFKQTIAKGNKIFIIISQKYLSSYHCIGELVEIWLYKQRDHEIFRKSTLIFMFDNVEFTENTHLAKYRMTWRNKAEELHRQAKEFGADGYEIQQDADFYNYAIPLIERIFPIIKTAIRENQWGKFIELAFTESDQSEK